MFSLDDHTDVNSKSKIADKRRVCLWNNIPRFKSSPTFGELVSALFFRKNFKDNQDALQAFSEQFAEYIGVSHAIPAPSARAALAGLLHALDLSKDGEVILPALTHHRIATMFLDFGLKPRFVDINPSTYCIDTDRLVEAINPSTVAIVPVHIYGRACNMAIIREIAERHKLVVIEDCAQSCGGTYSGQRLGSFGQGAIFSLGPFKNVCALGSGMVVTNSPVLADKISSWMSRLPQLGRVSSVKRLVFTMGICSVTKPLFWNILMAPVLKLYALRGLDPIISLTAESPSKKEKADKQTRFMPRPLQGVIGMSQLAKLDQQNSLRIRNGTQLLEYFKGISNVKLPEGALEGENIYMSFPVQVQDPKVFRRKMLRLGVDTHPGDKTFVSNVSGLEGSKKCSIAINAIESMVHLPVYPQMSESDILRVAEAVKIAAGG